VAAGLGRATEFQRLLPAATGEERHLALALASQYGQADIVRALLDTGEDPNRYNPVALHGHSTPLHQAAARGHEQVVRLLVERGARQDMRDTQGQATAADWAEHEGQKAIAAYLRPQ
jgi:ankyrin repeat protein